MNEQGPRSHHFRLWDLRSARGLWLLFSISYQGEGVSVVKVSSSGSSSRNFRVFMIKVTDISEASLQHGPCSKTRYKAFEGDHDQTSDNATNLLNLHV